MRQIFLDTETTGFDPDKGDRLVEIGCVEMVNRKLTGKNLHFYVNPERDMPEEAFRVHGLSTDFLRDKPKFKEVADQIIAYVAGAEIIMHNAPFDVRFLNSELAAVQRPTFKEHVATIVDTLVMAKEMFPGKRNGLDALCDRLEVDNSGRTFHGALLDAELLAEVYINMTRGQNALEIDVVSTHNTALAANQLDILGIELPVLQANAQELAAHSESLGQIDKASGGKTLWLIV
jgi:DNA polymerase III subunit epsilon